MSSASCSIPTILISNSFSPFSVYHQYFSDNKCIEDFKITLKIVSPIKHALRCVYDFFIDTLFLPLLKRLETSNCTTIQELLNQMNDILGNNNLCKYADVEARTIMNENMNSNQTYPLLPIVSSIIIFINQLHWHLDSYRKPILILAGLFHYLLSEVLELCGSTTSSLQRSIIDSKSVVKAMSQDFEILDLFRRLHPLNNDKSQSFIEYIFSQSLRSRLKNNSSSSNEIIKEEIISLSPSSSSSSSSSSQTVSSMDLTIPTLSYLLLCYHPHPLTLLTSKRIAYNLCRICGELIGECGDTSFHCDCNNTNYNSEKLLLNPQKEIEEKKNEYMEEYDICTNCVKVSLPQIILNDHCLINTLTSDISENVDSTRATSNDLRGDGCEVIDMSFSEWEYQINENRRDLLAAKLQSGNRLKSEDTADSEQSSACQLLRPTDGDLENRDLDLDTRTAYITPYKCILCKKSITSATSYSKSCDLHICSPCVVIGIRKGKLQETRISSKRKDGDTKEVKEPQNAEVPRQIDPSITASSSPGAAGRGNESSQDTISPLPSTAEMNQMMNDYKTNLILVKMRRNFTYEPTHYRGIMKYYHTDEKTMIYYSISCNVDIYKSTPPYQWNIIFTELYHIHDDQTALEYGLESIKGRTIIYRKDQPISSVFDRSYHIEIHQLYEEFLSCLPHGTPYEDRRMYITTRDLDPFGYQDQFVTDMSPMNKNDDFFYDIDTDTSLNGSNHSGDSNFELQDQVYQDTQCFLLDRQILNKKLLPEGVSTSHADDIIEINGDIYNSLKDLCYNEKIAYQKANRKIDLLIPIVTEYNIHVSKILIDDMNYLPDLVKLMVHYISYVPNKQELYQTRIDLWKRKIPSLCPQTDEQQTV